MGLNKKSVTAIIVTFNRKKELSRCLSAVLKQTRKVNNVLIVDNGSTDGTLNFLSDKYHFKLVKSYPTRMIKKANINSINLYLYRCEDNGGGSKGFYLGMKYSFEKIHSDLYWMMDDDGYPDQNCLDLLIKESYKSDYVMPTSIDIKNHNKLSWGVRKKNGKKTIDYSQLKASWGKIMDYVTPFNGVLLTKKCVDKVGYVNPNFFIWGDEYDHYWRCRLKGIEPVTILDARFFHPSQKLPLVKICFGLFRAPYVDSKLRMVCLARNYTYIYKKYGQAYKIPLKFLQYSWLFLITRHLDIRGWLLYVKSVNDGLHGNFERHKQYLK